MPMERERYPRCWDKFSRAYKALRGWQCECCDRPCRLPGESLHDFCDRLVGGNWRDNGDLWMEVAEHPQRYTLTVAHLDQDPGNNKLSNLRALCAPCHLRHDRRFRAFNSYRKRERRGQLRLVDVVLDEESLAGQGKDPTRVQLPIQGVNKEV